MNVIAIVTDVHLQRRRRRRRRVHVATIDRMKRRNYIVSGLLDEVL